MTAPLIASDATERPADDAGARNMLLLTQLRWVAIAGQLAAILAVRLWLRAPLPVGAMSAVLAGLVLLNLATLGVLLRRRRRIRNYQLFLALVIDWAALTAQLYLSGGVTNPFAPIGILQIVVAAVLLQPWSGWAIVGLHCLGFGLLAATHYPLRLPPPFASTVSSAYIFAGWLNFTLASVLILLFVTRIARNLRQRDQRLAALRQRAAEEDHIVRMGLLASGAAHELATPLASLSVILGDWKKQPAFATDPALSEEIDEMQAAVARCKATLGGILYAAGEARSEAVERTSLAVFTAETLAAWDAARPGVAVLDDALDRPVSIVADRTLKQVIFNLLDNAAEAGATRIVLRTERLDDDLRLTVRDNGRGFAPAMLAAIGKPYSSTKTREGAGLGLFLAVNVLRKLGGRVTATNGAGGGAVVTLSLPLAALELEKAHG